MSPEDVVARVSEVVSLPDLFTKLDEAINDPRSSFDEIAEILANDTGLCARLLRIVNSPFYGYPSHIDSISRAMTIIGTKQLRDLALATIVMDVFQGVESEHVNMEQFWRHSIACGVAGKLIATMRREANVERFFLMGILHDVGRLILFMECSPQVREALELAQQKNISLYQAEGELLGWDSSHLGKTLLEEWKLPVAQQEVVAYHHYPEKAFRYPDEAAVIHVADVMVTALELGSSGEPLVPELDQSAWSKTGVDVETMNLLVEKIEKEYTAVSDLFLSAA